MVVDVEDDAYFVHEADLFGIVAAEVVVLVGGVEAGGGGGAEGRAHFGEEVANILGCDGLCSCRGGRGRHCDRRNVRERPEK